MKRQVGVTCSMRGADYRFVYLVRTAGDAITDYCVLAGAGDYLKIMDFTATTSLVAQELLSGALALTPALALDASPGTLLEAAALSLGATTNSRDLSVTFMMAGILDVESAGAKVWRSVPALDNVEVRVWTAERDGVIHWVKSPERTITLEMKEPTLSAMLCRRLSVKTAIEEERITVVGHREGDIDALNEALRPCAWHYDFIDHL